MKIDGIQGESEDAKHKGEIELLSFSWGETNTSRSGPGGGAGKVDMQYLAVVMPVSRASPPLFLPCASGQHIKSAVLTGRKAGKAAGVPQVHVHRPGGVVVGEVLGRSGT